MTEVLWTLFELLINLFDAFLGIRFICTSLGHNYKSRRGKIIFAGGIIANAALLTVMNMFTIYEGWLGAIYSVFFFVYAMIFLPGSVQKKLFISIFTNLVLIAVCSSAAHLMSFALGDSVENIYSEQQLNRFLTILIVRSILAYVFEFLLRFTAGKISSLKKKEWALILSVLGISFVVFAAIHITAVESVSSGGQLPLLLAAEIGIILINIVCFQITLNLNKMRKREEELERLNKLNEYSRQYAETVKSQFEQTRQLRHDMKQYCAVADKLIADGKYSEARKILSENYENISQTEVVIDVGNDFINAILNAKLSLAKSRGIIVICSASKNISGIDDGDLCSLIGNLFDNSIEAAVKCPAEKRVIEIGINSSGSQLTVTVRNSIAASVLEKNPALETSKENLSEHGFGLKTIKNIAKKYGGSTDFYEEELMFVSRVILFMKSPF